MKVVRHPKDLQDIVRKAKQEGKSVGYLATMGALHEGHLTLARTIQGECDFSVVSVFVNPTQFNDPKDYQAYIIDVEADLTKLRAVGIDAAFVPDAAAMYPEGAQTWVTVEEVSQPLEGLFRPGHFRGVSTVVMKLFAAVQPDVTIFGEKDFQQVRLIEQMVRDLLLPIEVRRGAIVRDPDGLAMSSRNARLSPAGREKALAISRGLNAAAELARNGSRDAATLEGAVRTHIEGLPGTSIEYVALVDEEKLHPVQRSDGSCRLLVAMYVDGVRLIDNMRT